ncbi:SDR family oxidoreductase [Chitinophaga arvensicola]|uniref:NAD(P)-dependent dehydrogenase, short-chain alcohol dehydrogenase family n=1 Tax=Chitinophaga arvensicola TaxID=29529 RepID=A0A1I0RVL4_9BACT|nr:SDR family oxidoreductase [Chitinophaga arvensicola]SEW45560.1 NAD(P)-dependent dehydrogenase, short-chain alcohol dehydrogenase family [Chitinophaga arvensicola]
MKSALVTGANKGIGFEVARILAQQGFFVYLGSRDSSHGLAAVEKLKAEGLTHVLAVQLDVTSQSSVDAAQKIIAGSTEVLDVLVNNAGIGGEFDQSALDTGIDQYQSVFDTNFFGVVRVTQAFIPMMKRSAAPRIVNVSTAMASLSLAADIGNARYPKRYVIYQSSKSALNMYTVQLAYELRDTAFKVNAVCPGWTKTDFTNQQGTSTPEEAGQRIAKYALIGDDGPTAQYFSEEYFPAPANCPW